ncbi:MAG: GNAT family N-acetyltransferase [Deltaproteobacteria bacterium]|nr:GNAT family N-acetyltransferase [Deltaproteobacteria bacterium]MBW2413506.1 GNAT family N-acetyltransferase [Deltaproteobacteria bacterium]
MHYEEIRDRDAIEAFLRRDSGLHLYELADLDDGFWPKTRWFAALEAGEIRGLCLLFRGFDPPVLLALEAEGEEGLAGLVDWAAPHLGVRLYAHFTPSLFAAVEGCFDVERHGLHLKMQLREPSRLRDVDSGSASRLDPADLEELRSFYAPLRTDGAEGQYALEPYMLETGHYFAIRDARGISSAGGVHFCSTQYGVAALGNIATRRDARGNGLAKAVTARVCRSLFQVVPLVGLNVESGNTPAVRCYTALGFERCGSYVEATLRSC